MHNLPQGRLKLGTSVIKVRLVSSEPTCSGWLQWNWMQMLVTGDVNIKHCSCADWLLYKRVQAGSTGERGGWCLAWDVLYHYEAMVWIWCRAGGSSCPQTFHFSYSAVSTLRWWFYIKLGININEFCAIQMYWLDSFF